MTVQVNALGRPSGRDSESATSKPKRVPKTAVNRSVHRALELLLDVARSERAQSFIEFQKRHKLPKATLHKLLVTLETMEFLRRDEETGKYSIGIAAMEVAAAGTSSPGDLPNLLGEVLQKLVQDCNETCHLGILMGGEEVILKRLDPVGHVVRVGQLIGRRHPAYASAGGLASMALTFDDSAIDALPSRFVPLTENTIKNRDQLRARLKNIRKTGYAVEMEEAYIGVRCVGVAVAAPGWPAVHISFSVPLQRGSEERLHTLGKSLIDAAKDVKKLLSFIQQT